MAPSPPPLDPLLDFQIITNFDIRQTGPDWEIKIHLSQQHVAIAFIEDVKSIRKAKNQIATLASAIIEDTIFYQLYLISIMKSSNGILFCIIRFKMFSYRILVKVPF